MCNVRTITYACGHIIPFRLSTCGGNFTYKTRKSLTGTLPSCRSYPLLTFTSSQRCGACLKAAAEKDIHEEIARLQLEQASSTPEVDADDWTCEPDPSPIALAQAAAIESLTKSIWRLEKAYPDQSRFQKGVRPETGPRPTRSESLLHREVLSEEVVGKFEVNKTATTCSWDYESWAAEGYRDLGEEIREDDQERVDANLPAFTDCRYDFGEAEEESCGEALEEEQQDEEIGTVMDWGFATDWLVTENGNEDEGVGAKEDDTAKVEVEPKADATPESQSHAGPGELDNSVVEVKAEPNIGGAAGNQRPGQDTKPELLPQNRKENERTFSEDTKARDHPSGRLTITEKTQQIAMDGYQPFRACSPFWMEFAVSV